MSDGELRRNCPDCGEGLKYDAQNQAYICGKCSKQFDRMAFLLAQNSNRKPEGVGIGSEGIVPIKQEEKMMKTCKVCSKEARLWGGKCKECRVKVKPAKKSKKYGTFTATAKISPLKDVAGVFSDAAQRTRETMAFTQHMPGRAEEQKIRIAFDLTIKVDNVTIEE